MRFKPAYVVFPMMLFAVAAACSVESTGGVLPSVDPDAAAGEDEPDDSKPDAARTDSSAPQQDSGTRVDAAVDSGPDAAVGPKGPGEPCTSYSECKPWDCACKNGATFKNGRACINGTCPTQEEKCNVTCMGNGGWKGP